MCKKELILFLLMSLLVITAFHIVYAQVQTGSQGQSRPAVQSGSQTINPTIVFFYAQGCPDCARMESLLNDLLVGHEDLSVARYEINAPGSTSLLWKLANHYGVVTTRVPVIFVGDEAIVGTGRAQEFHLRTAIDDCATLGCPSPLDYAQGASFPWKDVLILGAFATLFLLLYFVQGG